MFPPLVGLYAKWGSGKSFLLRRLRRELESFTRGCWSFAGGAGLPYRKDPTLVLLALITRGRKLKYFTGRIFGRNLKENMKEENTKEA